MAKYIEYTRYSQLNRDRLLDFLSDNYSYQTAKNADEAIEACLNRLLLFPYQWQEVKTKQFGQLRRAIVNDLTIILYRVEDEKIVIFDFIDARSDWR